MMNYRIGDIVKGTITGIKPYGAFVALEDQSTGLIHISEISDGFVKDVHYFVKIGEVLELKVMDVDEVHHQYRLSLKALKPRQNRRKMGRNHMPNMDIGFRSLEASLPEWVKEKQGG